MDIYHFNDLEKGLFLQICGPQACCHGLLIHLGSIFVFKLNKDSYAIYSGYCDQKEQILCWRKESAPCPCAQNETCCQEVWTKCSSLDFSVWAVEILSWVFSVTCPCESTLKPPLLIRWLRFGKGEKRWENLLVEKSSSVHLGHVATYIQLSIYVLSLYSHLCL